MLLQPPVIDSSHQKEPSLKALKDSIPEFCFYPSVLVSFAYLGRDIAYASALIYCAWHIHLLPSLWLRAMAWVLYGFFQGCVGTGLWIIAHECGHGSFSLFPWLNDLVGWTTHSILLVPYFSWKITHARHHRYAGHMGRDTAFVPFTENEYAKKRGMSIQDVRNIAEDTPLVTLVNLALHQMLGWPMYLLAAVSAGNDSIRHDGEHRHRTKSHFDPMSGLFSTKERVYVLLSDLGVLAAGWALFHISSTIGRGDILLLYFMPYLWVNHWIGRCLSTAPFLCS